MVNEWNGLPNHIRESNSIVTFKKCFNISTCIYFSHISNSGEIPSMAHWRFWLSPSAQLFFSYRSVSLFHFIICLQCSGVNL